MIAAADITATTALEADILRTFSRRIDPADPGAQNNLGVLYYRRGMFDDAIASFSRALSLDERMRVARRNLVQPHRAGGDAGPAGLPPEPGCLQRARAGADGGRSDRVTNPGPEKTRMPG